MLHMDHDIIVSPTLKLHIQNFCLIPKAFKNNNHVYMENTSQAFMSQSYLNSQETATQATKDYLASLHSSRKQPSKPLKRPISSPLNPMHPHVYRVEPVNFKELVQRLTGAPEHEPVANPFKSLDDAAKDSSPSFAFDLSSSSWGDLSLRNPANISRW
ncbi:VQ motif-containing protein 29 [Brassica rapa]|nr:VQ motif-containing protein 29 [Brassica rapa]CAF2248569.1 unnamed protein product [Brassica napus]